MNKFSNTEFYTTPEGVVMVKQIGESVKELTQDSPNREFIEQFIDYIQNNFSEAYKELSKLYQKSKKNKHHYEFLIVSRFIRCNFSSYDTKEQDIDDMGDFNFEQVQCPLRGECTLENKCCNPKRDTILSDRELEVAQLIENGSTTDEIADALFISPNTVNAHRRNIHAKIKSNNKPGLISYLHKKKLV